MNTIPPATLDAYRGHGDPKARLEQEDTTASWILERWELGIRVVEVTRRPENENVEKCNQRFDKLMNTLVQRRPQHLTRESWN